MIVPTLRRLWTWLRTSRDGESLPEVGMALVLIVIGLYAALHSKQLHTAWDSHAAASRAGSQGPAPAVAPHTATPPTGPHSSGSM